MIRLGGRDDELAPMPLPDCPKCGEEVDHIDAYDGCSIARPCGHYVLVSIYADRYVLRGFGYADPWGLSGGT